jgi:hypothetical protein
MKISFYKKVIVEDLRSNIDIEICFPNEISRQKAGKFVVGLYNVVNSYTFSFYDFEKTNNVDNFNLPIFHNIFGANIEDRGWELYIEKAMLDKVRYNKNIEDFFEEEYINKKGSLKRN